MNFHVHILTPFKFESGREIPSLEIEYFSNTDDLGKKPLLFVCHPLTMNSKVEEWWPELFGTNQLFDSENFDVISPNILGSCYGTSSPSSINPKTGLPYLLDFPNYTIDDQINCNIALLNHLGIKEIDYLIGGSIGGMLALRWAVRAGKSIKNVISLGACFKTGGWAKALNASQRMALENDPEFFENKKNGAKKGLALARQIATISYRCPEFYHQVDENSNPFKDASSFQNHQGRLLSNRFCAYSYYYLTKCMDSHDVGKGFHSLEEALTSIRANVLFIAIEDDYLFPKEDAVPYLKYIKHYRYHSIKSIYGHDGIFTEFHKIKSIIYNSFFKNIIINQS